MKQLVHVQDIMSSSVVTCTPQDTESRAAQLMWDHDCGVIPIVNEAKFVVGMVTDRDVCMGAYTSGSTLASLHVGSAMSGAVQSCRPEDSLETAMSTMVERSVHRMPVVDDARHLVGIVSMADILRRIADMHDGGERRRLESKAVQALAAISRPRADVTTVVSGEVSAHAAV